MGRSLRPLVAVGLGGAAGSLVRWALATLSSDGADDAVLFAINVVGSLGLGLLLGGRERLAEQWRLGLGTGFAGGLTTFSGYAVTVAAHLDDGALLAATTTGIGTPIAAVIAAGIGFRATRMLGARPARPSGSAGPRGERDRRSRAGRARR